MVDKFKCNICGFFNYLKLSFWIGCNFLEVSFWIIKIGFTTLFRIKTMTKIKIMFLFLGSMLL